MHHGIQLLLVDPQERIFLKACSSKEEPGKVISRDQWIIIGTDSGFEGTNTINLQQ